MLAFLTKNICPKLESALASLVISPRAQVSCDWSPGTLLTSHWSGHGAVDRRDGLGRPGAAPADGADARTSVLPAVAAGGVDSLLAQGRF